METPHVPLRVERLPVKITKPVYESEVFQSDEFQMALRHTPDVPARRQPLPPPRLDAWDETIERRTRYLKRMQGVLEEYTREVGERAQAHGLVRWPKTRMRTRRYDRPR